MFCHICGSKLVDGALFCSNCGNKVISATSDKLKQQNNEPEKKVTIKEPVPLSINIEKVKQPSIIGNETDRDTLQLLHKHFHSLVRNERALYLYSENPEAIDAFQKHRVECYTKKEPLFVFDYLNKELADGGFIITPTTFALSYGERFNEFDLSEIREVKHRKSCLVDVMILEFFDNTISSKIYLTGIRNIIKFIEIFNNFLLELNRPEMYRKQQEQIQNKNITSLLEVSFKPYIGDATYCFVGTPLQSSHRKYKQAVENFEIDPMEKIFMVYDETAFGSCKKGFAVCEDGIYYRKKTMGHFSWDEFKTMPVKTGLTFKLGSLEFTTFKKDGNIAYNALSKLQGLLNA